MNRKATARLHFVNKRRTISNRPDTRTAAAEHLLTTPELANPASVAAYFSIGAEPGTESLLSILTNRGVRVLLPVLLPDNDLDWASYQSRQTTRNGIGIVEPTGTRLGVDAVSHVDVLIVPALAISPTGTRLGRGGGSYDRVLNRLAGASRPWTCALVYDHELAVPIPIEPHDQSVAAACSAERLLRFEPDLASGSR